MLKAKNTYAFQLERHSFHYTIKTFSHPSRISFQRDVRNEKEEERGGEQQGRQKDEKKNQGTGQDDAAPMGGEEEDKEVVVFVFDKATGTVKKRPVKTGIQDTKYIELTEGMKSGEEVVSEPYNVIFRTLKNGDKVKVVPKNELFETKK